MSPSTPADHPPDLDSSEATYPSSETAAPAASTPEELKRNKYELHLRGWRRIVANFTPSWFTITLDQVNPSWLFPVIADIVASGSGAIVANVLPDDQHAIWTVITSYVLWGTSVPMAIIILAMYYNRLMIHDCLPGQVAVTSFIAIGPLGQGAAAIQLLGGVALKLFSRNNFIPMAPIAGQFFYLTGILTALIMWGFALVWLSFALATIARRELTFNLTWWAFTFPLGVFTVATTTLAQELPSRFFKVLGTIFSVAETLLWIMVACGTIKASLNGELFKLPQPEIWEKRKMKEVEEDERAKDSPV
ncbi:hypothetical protein ACHAPA_012114 [Fusarium lateritium]